MTSWLDRDLRKLSLLLGAGLIAAFSSLWLAACQRSVDAEVESREISLTSAPQDTPVTGEGVTGETAQDTGKAAQGEAAPAAAGQDTGKAAQAEAAPAAAGADVYDGWKMYAVTCERCHGQDALGSAFAPDPRKSAATLGHDGFVQIVVNGRPEKGMPAFDGVLEPQQIENIYAYVQARGSGELGPGRPQQ